MRDVRTYGLPETGESLLAELQALAPRGSRPRTRLVLPYVQLDEWPSAAIVDRLREWARSLPFVVVRESRMASPRTSALCLIEGSSGGPPEAFIDGPEFCHLHPVPEGGLHLTLPEPVRTMAIDLCWAELHPVARSGALSPCLVLAYAPRDEREFAVARTLVSCSWRFARGASL